MRNHSSISIAVWARVFSFFAAAALCSLAIGCHHAEPSIVYRVGDKNAPLWSPMNPAATASLAAPVTLDGYTIQPPTGYREVVTPTTANGQPATGYAWFGPKYADGKAPMIEVVVTTVPRVISGVDSETLAQKMRLGVVDDAPKMSAPNPETAAINNIDFAGVYYSGIPNTGTVPVHGLIYGSVVDTDVVMIKGSAEEPDSATALPILQASALSLCKK